MCGPDIRVIGPRPSPCFAFALYGTLLHAVPKVGKLPSTAPVGQVGRKCSPPITPQPRIQGKLWRVKRMDRQRLGGMRKRSRAVVVVVLILLEQRLVTGGAELLLLVDLMS